MEIARIPKISEKQFSAQLMQYLRLMGWRVFHSWISIRSEPGFPDLVAVRADEIGGRVVFIETKTVTGKTTAAQDEWLAVLARVSNVETYVLRPDDDSWRLIEEKFR